MEQQAAPFLLVGLGNPGREYRETRHNIGFMFIDKVCKPAGILSLGKVQSKSLVGLGRLEGRRVVLAKPQTYMNLSGQAVGGLARFYKVPLNQILIVHDDIDLPLGALRIRPGGGSAGQKGIASIIQQFGTQDFGRLRLGVGRPPGRMDPAAYVLENFSKNEQLIVDQVLIRAVDAVNVWIRDGLDQAMTRFNGLISNEQEKTL